MFLIPARETENTELRKRAKAALEVNERIQKDKFASVSILEEENSKLVEEKADFKLKYENLDRKYKQLEKDKD